MSFVALDERRDPARALRHEHALGFVDEPSRQAAPTRVGGDGEAIDVAAPAIPSADDAPDDGAALDRDEEIVGVRPDQPCELLERIRRARDRVRPLPQRQHVGTFFETARPDLDHRALTPDRFAPHPGRPVSYVEPLREETHGDQA